MSSTLWRLACSVLAVFLCCWSAPAADSILMDDGESLPRNMTAREKALIAVEPIQVPAIRTGAPIGPVVTPGEYEAAEAIIVSWTGTSGWLNILAQMGAQITTIGDADLHVIHGSTSARNDAQSRLTNAGANMSRVKYFPISLNSIWVRDYGPRFVYEGGVRTIVDHTYNRPRPQDNAMPTSYAAQRDIIRYDLPLIHGGGNYHLFSEDPGFATVLIGNENPGLSQSEIIAIWQQYQNLATTLTSAFPTSVDSTQHIDMWMIPVSDTAIIVSEWPAQPGTVQANICNAFASTMQGLGYTVFRTPARTVSGTHYTYTNSVVCNDLILIPSYTNSTVSPYNAQALSVWQAAAPGKTIVQINCQAIVTAAGVMHCIVKHVPANSGGENPVAYLRTPRGGAVFNPDDVVVIEWISDDDLEVTSIDVLLSVDGGENFDTVLASGLTEKHGTFAWTVPDLYTEEGMIRVVAWDSEGNSGTDQGDGFFIINGVISNPCVGDINGDFTTDLNDFGILALNFGVTDGASFEDGDLDGNGAVDLDDFAILATDFGCSL